MVEATASAIRRLIRTRLLLVGRSVPPRQVRIRILLLLLHDVFTLILLLLFILGLFVLLHGVAHVKLLSNKWTPPAGEYFAENAYEVS
jgi:hypothetical protein